MEVLSRAVIKRLFDLNTFNEAERTAKLKWNVRIEEQRQIQRRRIPDTYQENETAAQISCTTKNNLPWSNEAWPQCAEPFFQQTYQTARDCHEILTK
jgi:hypothetical protein